MNDLIPKKVEWRIEAGKRWLSLIVDGEAYDGAMAATALAEQALEIGMAVINRAVKTNWKPEAVNEG